MAVLVLIAACEREAPSCDVIARHAQAHLLARNTLAPIELARLAIRHPFSGRITEQDARYIEDQCEDWSAEYRLCVIEQHGGGWRCGREDIVWATLPHVRDWLEELEGRASSISWIAEHRVAELDVEIERLESELALSNRTSSEWMLRDKLTTVQDRRRSARMLELACAANPLEQPACVALLP